MRDKSVLGRVEIRRLDRTDSVSELTELLHRAFAKGPGQPYNYPAAQQNDETTAEQVQRGRCCVAVMNGRIVGLGIVWPPAGPATRWGCPRRRVAHFRQLAVEPDLQKMGLGTAILDACERTAVEMGASELSGSSPVGSRQLSLYKRRGYRVRRYVSWSNTDYDRVVFAKRLKRTDTLDGLRYLVDKTRYLVSLVMYKTRQLLRATAAPCSHVPRAGGILSNIERKAGKLLTRKPWKRRFRLLSSAEFWKMKFMGLSVLRLSCWIARSLTNRLGSGRPVEILLHCPAVQCAEHLKRFSDLFKDDSRLQFKVVFPLYAKKVPTLYERMRGLLPYEEVSSLRAYLCNWSMIVVADHPRYPLLLSPRKCPTLYIGHGPANKSTPGSQSTRPYGGFALEPKVLPRLLGTAKPLYDRMFEGEERIRELAVKANPVFDNVIVVVGNLTYDQILSQASRREEFRRQLGITPEETVVLVFSTWRPECLFRSVGDAFLEESRKLLGEFKFILSVHPNEYLPKPQGERVWGEYLRTQRKYGYIVREPNEDFIPYMVASDIVLTDHTCLADYAVLLRKPIICIPVDTSYIWKGSITWEIYQFAPILEDMRGLRAALLRAMDDYPRERLVQLERAMNPYPDQAAGRIRNEVYTLLRMSSPDQRPAT